MATKEAGMATDTRHVTGAVAEDTALIGDGESVVDVGGWSKQGSRMPPDGPAAAAMTVPVAPIPADAPALAIPMPAPSSSQADNDETMIKLWLHGRAAHTARCIAPGCLDNRLRYAARLKVSSCQVARIAAGLR
jgi:hypothetical protein